MSAALRLAQLQKQKAGEPLAVAVLEKARETGAHMLSGAVLDPSTLKDLVPDFKEKGAPLGAAVQRDDVYFLTRSARFRLPITPPFFRNHGNYIISLNRFVKWLGGLVEAEGVDIFTGFAATEVLFDPSTGAGQARVVGVRTGDRGIDKHGQKKSTFEPGVDIRAKVTILTDGVRGNITKSLVRRLGLDDGKSPAVYAIGIKEVWEVPAGRVQPGRRVHPLGFPLNLEQFGGAFISSLPDNLVALGLVAGLDYKDPMFDPHVAFQHLKRHPFIASMLQGGTLVRYGAKALPEGGWYTIPKTYAAGVLIAGDAAGFMNSARLKGIHLAMRTGMLAAETAFEAVRTGDVSEAALKAYDDRVQGSAVRKELYPVRNVHQAFGFGTVAGAAFTGLSLVTGGGWFKDPLPAHGGWTRIRRVADYYKDARPDPESAANPVKIDPQVAFERLPGVHRSGTPQTAAQPSPVTVQDASVCAARGREEYGRPCIRFCPANVYEMVDAGDGTKKLQVNASNCVHCKTSDIMDPYQIIDWV